jgi:hypothetical protein
MKVYRRDGARLREVRELRVTMFPPLPSYGRWLALTSVPLDPPGTKGTTCDGAFDAAAERLRAAGWDGVIVGERWTRGLRTGAAT